METQEIIIVGSGPAAYTAAIYLARASLRPLVIEGFFSGPAGGQLMSTTEVENFPGFPEGISGPELMERFRQQAEKFGAVMLTEDVEKVDFSSHPFILYTADKSFSTKAVIIATGASAKRLDIPGAGEGEFWQKGVTACAVCDGAMPIFRNKDLYVIGGGDTAAEEAIFLTKFAKHVFVVHRRSELRASKIMTERLLAHPKITILWNHVVEAVKGKEVVSSVVLKDLISQKNYEKEAGGLFFAVGHLPNTAFLHNQLQLTEHGYITVHPGTCITSKEGVFAAGDVQDPLFRQAITAAGSGCMAALTAERWLMEHS